MSATFRGPSGSFASPPPPQKPGRLRDIADALRNTPHAFRLVWAADRRSAVGVIVLTIISAALPAAQAWTAKLIIDAVVIATSDHWHCLCTLHAADAGKDIYCEKPLCTTIAEGHAMVDAVKRNNIVFQGGNMQRSGKHFQEAVQLVWDKYIGDVARVETWSHDNNNLDGIGMGETDLAKYEAPDYGIDWEFHQGWVEHRPFNTNRWIYNFRWFLEYSGGKITDWGAHLIDIALWGMGEQKQPRRISAQGGKYLIKDNRTTPDTLEVAWEFEDYLLTFSNRVWNPQLLEGTQSDQQQGAEPPVHLGHLDLVGLDIQRVDQLTEQPRRKNLEIRR